jgi:hypothetical protein
MYIKKFSRRNSSTIRQKKLQTFASVKKSKTVVKDQKIRYQIKAQHERGGFGNRRDSNHQINLGKHMMQMMINYKYLIWSKMHFSTFLPGSFPILLFYSWIQEKQTGEKKKSSFSTKLF